MKANSIDTMALRVRRVFEPEVYAALGRSKAIITRTRDRSEGEKETILGDPSGAWKQQRSSRLGCFFFVGRFLY